METRARGARGWLARRVPMAERRPLLLEALNGLYAAREGGRGRERRAESATAGTERGFVSLVGAGPGDPGLLTRRRSQRLRRADLVLYDALVDPRALALAPRAQRFFVGKRAGRHAVTPGVIIRAADSRRHAAAGGSCGSRAATRSCSAAAARKRWRSQRAGIPYEVVPGVSAAIAAPALAGIPVTHRGLASGFVVVSGHAEEFYRADPRRARAGGATVVMLMGSARVGGIAGLLVDAGWSARRRRRSSSSAAAAGARRRRGDARRISRAGVEAARTDGRAPWSIGEVVALRGRAGRAARNGRRRSHAATGRAGAG